MLCTKRGYSLSNIFSLFAKSSARSKGILKTISSCGEREVAKSYIPYALEMHGADFHNVAAFLAFEYSIATSTRHASHIQELRSVDHVVIFDKSLAMCSSQPCLHSEGREIADKAPHHRVLQRKVHCSQPESTCIPHLPITWQ